MHTPRQTAPGPAPLASPPSPAAIPSRLKSRLTRPESFLRGSRWLKFRWVTLRAVNTKLRSLSFIIIIIISAHGIATVNLECDPKLVFLAQNNTKKVENNVTRSLYFINYLNRSSPKRKLTIKQKYLTTNACPQRLSLRVGFSTLFRVQKRIQDDRKNSGSLKQGYKSNMWGSFSSDTSDYHR